MNRLPIGFIQLKQILIQYLLLISLLLTGLMAGSFAQPYNYKWGSYLGANGALCGFTPGDGYIHDVTVDSAGNIYVTGKYGCNFPTTAGAFQTAYGGSDDVFVAKLSPNGQNLLWAGYLGGGDDESGNSIAVDDTGNVYVCGFTKSSDFPTTVGSFQTTLQGIGDAFVAKISPDGSSLIYSTLLGGTNNEIGYGIAVNSIGEAYISGATNSNDFPATSGSYDITYNGPGTQLETFVAKLNLQGNALVYGTYLGGATGTERGIDIAINSAGEAYITGKTSSTDFPVLNAFQPVFNTAGFFEGFITKLSASGSSLVFSSFLGGSGDDDFGCGIAVDNSGAAYITGYTESSDFPVTSGAFQTTFAGGSGGGGGGPSDAFVTKVSSSGSLVYSSYLGGSSSENKYNDTFNDGLVLSLGGWGKIDVDSKGRAFVGGHTQSTNFPVTSPTYQSLGGGAYDNYDGFVSVLDSAGSSLVYSSYIGGSTIVPGGNSARDYNASIVIREKKCPDYVDIVGVITTHSDGFPTTAGVYMPAKLNSWRDQPVVFKFTSDTVPFSTSISGNTTICSGDSTTLTATGGTSYSWNTGDTTSAIKVSPTSGTTYSVSVSNGSCSDTANITVTVSSGPSISVSGNTAICLGDSTVLTASGGTTYLWSTGATASNITVLPATATSYSVTVSNGSCADDTSITVNVNPTPTASISGSTTVCSGDSALLTASGGTTYLWSTGATDSGITVSPSTSTSYSVTVSSGSCMDDTSITVNVNPIPAASIAGNTAVCTGDIITLTASGGTGYLWNSGATTAIITDNPADSTSYAVTVTDGNGCEDDTSVTVMVSPPPVASISGDTLICSGETSILTASGGGNYLWNNNATTSSINVSSAGIYSVIVSIGACSDTAVAAITVNSNPVASVVSSPATCGNTNGSATATASGVASPYAYSWNTTPPQASPTATGLPAGSYIVTVTDANGCSQTQTATVTAVPGPAAAVTAATINIIFGNSVQLTATGGGAYQWTPSAGLSCATCSSATATPLQTTTYCALVTDTNNCSDSACITINVEIPCGEVFVPNAFSPNKDGQNEIECVLGNCIKTITFSIYDRWGEKVFEYSGSPLPSGGVGGGPCWDGMYKGTLMNTATFAYYLRATLTTGEQITKKGNISLIR